MHKVFKHPSPRTLSAGFTIVELLIVIVVIGILAAITIVAFNGTQEKSRTAVANTELRMLEKAILAARNNESKHLMGVTGSNCTRCSDQARYELTLDRISAAASMNLAGLKDGDPWGEKYFIDENEGEGATGCTSRDSIGLLSAHPGIISVTIPFFGCNI